MNHKLTAQPWRALGTLLPRKSVNGAGNIGALLNLNDGYLHVAWIGGIGSNLGWNIDEKEAVCSHASRASLIS